MNARMLMALAAVLMLVSVADLSGQEVERYVGSRVRLTIRTPFGKSETLMGTLTAVDRDSLRLQRKKDGTTMSVSLSLIEKLQVTWGRKRNVKKGLLIGSVGGLAAGAALGAALGEECSADDFICFGRGLSAAGGGIVGMFAGGVVGGVLGSVTKSHRWKAVPLTRLRVADGSQRGGLGFTVAASINF